MAASAGGAKLSMREHRGIARAKAAARKLGPLADLLTTEEDVKRAEDEASSRLAQMERHKRSVVYLQALVENQPNNGKAWRKLARAKYKLWQETMTPASVPDVQETFAKALQFRANADSPDMWWEVTQVYVSFGAHASALDLTQRIVLDFPKYGKLSNVMFLASILYRHLKRFGDAVTYMLFLLRPGMLPKPLSESHILVQLAWTYELQADAMQAKDGDIRDRTVDLARSTWAKAFSTLQEETRDINAKRAAIVEAQKEIQRKKDELAEATVTFADNKYGRKMAAKKLAEDKAEYDAAMAKAMEVTAGRDVVSFWRNGQSDGSGWQGGDSWQEWRKKPIVWLHRGRELAAHDQHLLATECFGEALRLREHHEDTTDVTAPLVRPWKRKLNRREQEKERAQARRTKEVAAMKLEDSLSRVVEEAERELARKEAEARRRRQLPEGIAWAGCCNISGMYLYLIVRESTTRSQQSAAMPSTWVLEALDVRTRSALGKIVLTRRHLVEDDADGDDSIGHAVFAGFVTTQVEVRSKLGSPPRITLRRAQGTPASPSTNAGAGGTSAKPANMPLLRKVLEVVPAPEGGFVERERSIVVADDIEEHRQAAREIQRVLRGGSARKLVSRKAESVALLRDRSSRTIQKLARGRSARVFVRHRRLHVAATKIQKLARSYSAWALMRLAKKEREREEYERRVGIIEPTAADLSAAERAEEAELWMQAAEAGLRTGNKEFLAVASEKAAAMMGNADNIEARDMAVLAHAESEVVTGLVEARATFHLAIQLRVYVRRRKLFYLHSRMAKRIQRKYQAHAARQWAAARQGLRKRGVSALQARIRGRLGRKRAAAERERQVPAIVLIQSAWRRTRAKKRVWFLRFLRDVFPRVRTSWAQRKISCFMKAAAKTTYMRRMRKAALTVQCAWRQYLARRRLEWLRERWSYVSQKLKIRKWNQIGMSVIPQHLVRRYISPANNVDLLEATRGLGAGDRRASDVLLEELGVSVEEAEAGHRVIGDEALNLIGRRRSVADVEALDSARSSLPDDADIAMLQHAASSVMPTRLSVPVKRVRPLSAPAAANKGPVDVVSSGMPPVMSVLGSNKWGGTRNLSKQLEAVDSYAEIARRHGLDSFKQADELRRREVSADRLSGTYLRMEEFDDSLHGEVAGLRDTDNVGGTAHWSAVLPTVEVGTSYDLEITHGTTPPAASQFSRPLHSAGRPASTNPSSATAGASLGALRASRHGTNRPKSAFPRASLSLKQKQHNHFIEERASHLGFELDADSPVKSFLNRTLKEGKLTRTSQRLALDDGHWQSDTASSDHPSGDADASGPPTHRDSDLDAPATERSDKSEAGSTSSAATSERPETVGNRFVETKILRFADADAAPIVPSAMKVERPPTPVPTHCKCMFTNARFVYIRKLQKLATEIMKWAVTDPEMWRQMAWRRLDEHTSFALRRHHKNCNPEVCMVLVLYGRLMQAIRKPRSIVVDNLIRRVWKYIEKLEPAQAKALAAASQNDFMARNGVRQVNAYVDDLRAELRRRPAEVESIRASYHKLLFARLKVHAWAEAAAILRAMLAEPGIVPTPDTLLMASDMCGAPLSPTELRALRERPPLGHGEVPREDSPVGLILRICTWMREVGGHGNIRLYNNALRAVYSSSDWGQAVRVYAAMRQARVDPNKTTFELMLKIGKRAPKDERPLLYEAFTEVGVPYDVAFKVAADGMKGFKPEHLGVSYT